MKSNPKSLTQSSQLKIDFTNVLTSKTESVLMLDETKLPCKIIQLDSKNHIYKSILNRTMD